MTFEELKAEAKAQGYSLIKIVPKVKLEPCLCGCNRREHRIKWTGVEELEILRCTKCGREAWGRSEKEAKANWNRMIVNERQSDCPWK